MSDIYVKVKINLKTGFFRTEAYVLQVFGEYLELIPISSDAVKEITIDFTNIKAITISSGEPIEIEIRANQATWIGTFPKMVDLGEIIKVFRMVLGKKFIYI